MSGKCDDCKVEYTQFKATSRQNEDGIFQTKRYYRCRKCGTIYIEIDPLQDENYHNGITVVEKIKPIENKSVKKKSVQSKLW